MKSGSADAGKFPKLAKVVPPKSSILKMNDDPKHTLEKIGAWLSEGKNIYVHGAVEATFNGEPCKAVQIKVPDPKKPGNWLTFHLIYDDVEFQEEAEHEAVPTTH
jgi:hypothetical protein